MIAQRAFHAEPWSVRETMLDLDLSGQAESVFALANGRIRLRANLDEGAPVAIPHLLGTERLCCRCSPTPRPRLPRP
jgi:trehalose/maltose hydrolase-like predicted phosphorylase